MSRKLITIPLEQLSTEGNIRSVSTDLRSLAQSFRNGEPEQPPLVQPNGNGYYQVIFGGRRVDAARLLGTAAMACLVVEPMDRRTQITLQLVENLHREDLSPLDEARAIQDLLELGASQLEIANMMQRSQSYICQRLALLNLSPNAQDALAAGTLSASVAEEIMRLPHAQQDRVLGHVQGATVKQAQQIVTQDDTKRTLAKPAPVTEDVDEYDALLDEGDDPLLVLALAQLREAEELVKEVYRDFKLSGSTGHIRRMLKFTLRQTAETVAAILRSLEESDGKQTK